MVRSSLRTNVIVLKTCKVCGAGGLIYWTLNQCAVDRFDRAPRRAASSHGIVGFFQFKGVVFRDQSIGLMIRCGGRVIPLIVKVILREITPHAFAFWIKGRFVLYYRCAHVTDDFDL
jgi:hypothetical protein